jgi:hypothetical protein
MRDAIGEADLSRATIRMIENPADWPDDHRYSPACGRHDDGRLRWYVCDNRQELPDLECHSALESQDLARRLNGRAPSTPAADDALVAALGKLLVTP